jgi:hypothetical protein
MNEVDDVIIVDIDGTIALKGNRDPYDYALVKEDFPNKKVISVVMQLENWNDVVFVSGRNEICREDTEQWLAQIGFEKPELYMRRLEDYRSDEIVKKEIYYRHISPRNVLCVFDDRNKVVKMWRELGLTCLQVADGDF